MADDALGRVLDAESARFDDVWDQLSKEQRATLTALASTDGSGIFAESYRRADHLGSAASVQGAVRRLIERQLVERIPRGRYIIPDVFFRAWIARRVASSSAP